MLDVRVVKRGDGRKFTSKYKAIIELFMRPLCKCIPIKQPDMADNLYVPQRVYVNHLKPIFDTMFWRPYPAFEPTFDAGDLYRKSVDTQTTDNLIENAYIC